MPIEGVLSSDGAGPEEESVRDDGSDWDDEGKRTGWNRQKHRRPIIVSPFGSFLTTFEVDRTLFNYLAFASEPPPGLIVNFGRVARYYEVIYDVIRLGPRRLGGEYDHLH